MNRQNQKRIQSKKIENTDSSPEQKKENSKYQHKNESESYHSYFYRNRKDEGEHSSQTKIKSRMKTTRIKEKSEEQLYYELQSTRNNEEDSLREENNVLKQTIAELKIMQLYQIDQKKIRDLLEELENVKQQVKNLKKQNEKLKIQNDFLNRNNFQLKLKVNRLVKRHEICKTQANMIQHLQNDHLQKDGRSLLTPRTSTMLPEHLLILNRNMKCSKIIQQEQKSPTPPRKSFEKLETPKGKSLSKALNLGRVCSEKNMKINGASNLNVLTPKTKIKRLTSANEDKDDLEDYEKELIRIIQKN